MKDSDNEKFSNECQKISNKISDEKDKLDDISDKLKEYSTNVQEIYDNLENGEDVIKVMEGFRIINMELPIFDPAVLDSYEKCKVQVDGLQTYKGELNNVQDFLKNYDKMKNNLGTILYTIPDFASEIMSYDIETGKSHHHKLTLIKEIPMRFGFAFNRNSIYIVGGTIDMVNHLSDAWEINLNTRVERKLPNLNIGRSENTLVLTRERLICIGGRNSEEYIRSIERVDPSGDSVWKELVKLDRPRSHIGAVYCPCHNKVYMYGGLEQSEAKPIKILPTNYLTILNLEKATLENIILKTPKVHSAGVICTTHSRSDNCSLMIFGGQDEEDKVINDVYLCEKFNTKELPKLLKGDIFYSQQPLSIDNKIFVLGRKYFQEYDKEGKEENKATRLYKIGRAHV